MALRASASELDRTVQVLSWKEAGEKFFPGVDIDSSVDLASANFVPSYLAVNPPLFVGHGVQLPPIPRGNPALLRSRDSNNCWFGSSSPEGQISSPISTPLSTNLYGLCCGGRSSFAIPILVACWGFSNVEKAAELRAKCCPFQQVCNVYEIYSLDLSSVFKWPAIHAVPPLHSREELACVLEAESKKRGVELGVFDGHFAKNVLHNWHHCQEYVLVDLWSAQENYDQDASGSYLSVPERAAQVLSNALRTTAPWREKVRVCRGGTTECHEEFHDEYFDFVYVDARHDRHSVRRDLDLWWPKLKPGGIMAGHDYVTQFDLLALNWPLHLDPFWARTPNGTVEIDGLLVKGAVDEFALHVERPVFVTHRTGQFDTWILRK
eukprot:GHVT01017495.1.p1 GENE.GHVT01017495.1~~GHVT01017495.1.p1  ORF type:complete len:402 (-),score=17.59 GHVT01017495.1:196-1332(-)